MKRISGRVSDIPRIKGMFVVPRAVQNVLDRYPELGRFQLVVDRPARQDELTIRIVLKQAVDRQSLGRRLATEIREAIRLSAAIELVAMQDLADGAPLVDDRRKIS